MMISPGDPEYDESEAVIREATNFCVIYCENDICNINVLPN